MYASRLMETGDLDDIFYESRNPYTMALLNSIPDLEGVRAELEAIPGNPPSLLNPPSGCAFRPRCSYAVDECAAGEPPVVPLGEAHSSRCFRTADLGMGVGAAS